MQQLKTFSNNQFTVLATKDIDKILFDAETVAKSLGLTTVAKSGNVCVRWQRVNAYLKLTGSNQISKGSFITEQQAYKLAFKANNSLAEQFQDWLAEDVIPSIRKTGKYEVKQEIEQTVLYDYFDKTYNGMQVLTSKDIEHFTGINAGVINWFLRNKAEIGKDFYRLTGIELSNFKTENPRMSRMSKCLYVITRSGFLKICKAYGIKIEEPKCFENKQVINSDNVDKTFSINKILNKLRKDGYNISVKDLTQELADDYTDGIIRNQSLTIKIDNKYYIFVDGSAPLQNKRYLAAQGIGCVISGQLRGNRKCSITDYSKSALSFASALMAMSLFFDV